MLELKSHQDFVIVNGQHIVTDIARHTLHADPSIKQFENEAPVIQALVVIQISTLSQMAQAAAHMFFMRVKCGNRQEKIQDSSPLGVSITPIPWWLSSYWCLFSNPWLYRSETSTVSCVCQWVTGVVTSITSSHQWCKSFPFPFSTTNRYSPMLSCQDIQHTQEWGIMEKPFQNPSRGLWAAQPLAFRQCETVLSVGIGKTIPSWELGAATSWNPGKGTSPQPWGDLGFWLLGSAKWKEQGSGKAHEGQKGLVEWQFYSKFSSKRSSHKERGNMRNVMQIKQPESLHLPWISGCQLSCEDAQGVFQRFHLVSLEILPFKGKLVFTPVFQHCISTFTKIPTKTPQKQILGQS